MSAVVTESKQEPRQQQPALPLSNPLASLAAGIPLDPLPPPLGLSIRDPSQPHAPAFQVKLTDREFRLALRNALRYFPAETHAELAPEFAHELREYGHIFMYRFRPTHYVMRAHPLSAYPARTRQVRLFFVSFLSLVSLVSLVSRLSPSCLSSLVSRLWSLVFDFSSFRL
jgi:hypothetical protein